MISMDKKYRLRSGEAVRLYCTDAGGPQPVHAAYQHSDGTWIASTWSAEGHFNFNDLESSSDLIEVNPWEGFKVDDRVLVRQDASEAWKRRYFAGVEYGRALCFENGADSWSSNSAHMMDWNECIKWEPEL